MEDRCELCGREARTTEHHLIPRSRKKQDRDTFGPTARACRDCHRMIHATFDNKRLARELPSIAKLREAPELQAYLKWIRKRPSTAYFGSRSKKS
jgi:5-methylcytosine-specific restriction enzyme A